MLILRYFNCTGRCETPAETVVMGDPSGGNDEKAHETTRGKPSTEINNNVTETIFLKITKTIVCR